MKHCPSCKKIKEINEFHKNKTRYDGLQTHCKNCLSERRKKYNIENKDLVLSKRKIYRQNRKDKDSLLNHNLRRRNPAKYLLKYAMRRSKESGLEFSLSLKDIQIPDRCPILNIPLFVSKGRPSDNSPSIDRIDNTRGYIPGNIIVCSWKANSVKNDTDIILLEEYLDKYLNI